ncbi:hypothetical protein ACVDG3_01555 [Meridianimarinicoccus sp. RP-17]|uniref:hypothetical protein n=1 Tax=Meridianimarinicoccus zhengii TaxID=2056810 RepID=UPI0013A69C77|nr:hypothetical protein [Phycocomes zhengii]
MRICDVDITEINYDAGRPSHTLEMIDLGHCDYPFKGKMSLDQIFRFRAVHKKFLSLLRLHEALSEKESIMLGFCSPWQRNFPIEESVKDVTYSTYSLHDYHFLAESFVFDIRRFFETHLHLMQIIIHRGKKSNSESFPDAIDPDDLGALIRNRESRELQKTLSLCFFDDQDTEDRTLDYLGLINCLGNAMRHHALFSDAFNLLGHGTPTLVGYEFNNKKNNSKIRPGARFHNHNIFHLMMGFQDTSQKIIARSKRQLHPQSNAE